MKKFKNLNYLKVDFNKSEMKFVMDKGTKSLDVTSIYNELEEIVTTHNNDPDNIEKQIAEMDLLMGDLKVVGKIETVTKPGSGYNDNDGVKIMITSSVKEIEDSIEFTKEQIKNLKNIKDQANAFTNTVIESVKKQNSN